MSPSRLATECRRPGTAVEPRAQVQPSTDVAQAQLGTAIARPSRRWPSSRLWHRVPLSRLWRRVLSPRLRRSVRPARRRAGRQNSRRWRASWVGSWASRGMRVSRPDQRQCAEQRQCAADYDSGLAYVRAALDVRVFTDRNSHVAWTDQGLPAGTGRRSTGRRSTRPCGRGSSGQCRPGATRSRSRPARTELCVFVPTSVSRPGQHDQHTQTNLPAGWCWPRRRTRSRIGC
jgi:hypothetical protein